MIKYLKQESEGSEETTSRIFPQLFGLKLSDFKKKVFFFAQWSRGFTLPTTLVVRPIKKTNFFCACLPLLFFANICSTYIVKFNFGKRQGVVLWKKKTIVLLPLGEKFLTKNSPVQFPDASHASVSGKPAALDQGKTSIEKSLCCLFLYFYICKLFFVIGLQNRCVKYV